jgi:predicted urease superfamily metal-dependent hydrolase
MTVVYKTKSEQRVETSEAIQQFLASGGSIQIVPAKKTRKRTTQKMASKSSRGFQGGTNGFATGYPRKSI